MQYVYILGTGSQWQDNELRYSLRSLAQDDREVMVFLRRKLGLLHILHDDIF